jgi:hypothetical protein
MNAIRVCASSRLHEPAVRGSVGEVAAVAVVVVVMGLRLHVGAVGRETALILAPIGP